MSDTMDPRTWHDDAAPPPPPPPPARTTWQVTTIVVLSILLVAAVGGLVALWLIGAGGDSTVEDLEARLAEAEEERDSLEATVATLEADADATAGELGDLRNQRTASDACRRSATIALGFITDFEEWRQMDAAWWATPEGSAEEANLDLALEAAMSSLRDTASDLKVASETCTGEE